MTFGGEHPSGRRRLTGGAGSCSADARPQVMRMGEKAAAGLIRRRNTQFGRRRRIGPSRIRLSATKSRSFEPPMKRMGRARRSSSNSRRGVETSRIITFTESFSTIEGELGVLTGTERRLLRRGQNATVPPGMVHCFCNPSDQVAKFRGEARPSQPGLDHFIQIAYGLARDGQVNKKGSPKKRAHIAILMEMGDMRMPGLGFKLVVPFLRWVRRRARKRGLEKQLIERYCS
jgi:mannose-6-phosphate isomerase-like protein (cupin superfamily)